MPRMIRVKERWQCPWINDWPNSCYKLGARIKDSCVGPDHKDCPLEEGPPEMFEAGTGLLLDTSKVLTDKDKEIVVLKAALKECVEEMLDYYDGRVSGTLWETELRQGMKLLGMKEADTVRRAHEKS